MEGTRILRTAPEGFDEEIPKPLSQRATIIEIKTGKVQLSDPGCEERMVNPSRGP
jgi:hypothetical protein